MRIAFLQSTLFISFFCLFLMLLAFSYVFFGYMFVFIVFFFFFLLFGDGVILSSARFVGDFALRRFFHLFAYILHLHMAARRGHIAWIPDRNVAKYLFGHTLGEIQCRGFWSKRVAGIRNPALWSRSQARKCQTASAFVAIFTSRS